jgi:acetylornithine deacetylase
MERRTVAGEDEGDVAREIDALLADLRRADPEFDAAARATGYRSAYCLDAAHPLARTLGASLTQAGLTPEPVGMSFWTDAAILAEAGIPSLLFGPGGAGLHSVEEYVHVADVYTCRDVLVATVRSIVATRG